MGRLDPRRRWGPQGRRNPGSPHSVPITAGGEGHGQGGGDENPPPTRPTQEQAPDGGGRAVPWGATERATMAAAARTDAGAGGAGNLAAHPTLAALAAAAGGLVDGDWDSRGGGTDGAGHTPAQTPAAAEAVSEGAQVRARLAPEPNAEKQTAVGDKIPRRAGATKSTAEEAMVERDPPERQQALNARGR